MKVGDIVYRKDTQNHSVVTGKIIRTEYKIIKSLSENIVNTEVRTTYICEIKKGWCEIFYGWDVNNKWFLYPSQDNIQLSLFDMKKESKC